MLQLPLSTHSYSCVYLLNTHPQSPRQESFGYIFGQVVQDLAIPYFPQFTPISEIEYYAKGTVVVYGTI